MTETLFSQQNCTCGEKADASYGSQVFYRIIILKPFEKVTEK